MENIDTLLIVFGVLLALIVAGWTIFSHRKEKSRVFSNSFSSQPQPNPSFGQENPLSVAPPSEQNFGASPIADYSPMQGDTLPQESVQQDIEKELGKIQVRLSDQVAPQQNVQLNNAQPNIEQTAPQPEIQVQIQPQQSQPEPEPEPAIPANQIQLYVMASQGQVFAGSEFVKQLENLGFLYGESNLFHRHIDGTSASPVVYSVANAYNPGVFDLTQIHQLSTAGLIFFMYLPSAGNDLVNFNQLLNDAKDLAQALNGWVVDDQGNVFDEDSRYRYLAKLRQPH
ncbi:cell division protein ZipA [Haemophilus paracuniculus]|uniref:Cell division protein ZipA n=1 Tax=Haemophilus paracuniculus TaxID=734 RepID=A0A1T0ATK8_9PAST|nr:cell division protein ZipA [Haemophilus paracuniculus]OOR99946.1 cell division protein ZipA [Haemophilus paracuniculus]